MDLKVEIFAVGQWNGMEFKKEDLDIMASSFSSLSVVHKVPLKFGHNNDQPFTDGQPALGWVSDVWVDGTKLMAKFSNIPEVVFKAIEKKLYKHVSVELDMGVEHKGTYYAWVLSGVALLGADIPAVNTLADLTSYMGRSDELTFKKRVAFTAININSKTEEFTVNELEKAQAELVKLQAQVDANAEQLQTFSKDKASDDAKIAKFEAEQLKAVEEAEKTFFTKSKETMIEKLEILVKSGSITPAQREKFTADFKEDKDVIERLNFTLEILEVGAKGSKDMDTKETSITDNKDDEGKSPDEILMARISELRVKEPSMDFSSARNRVMKADPELAKSYRDMNGEG